MHAYFLDLFTYEDWANRLVINSLLKVEAPPDRAVQIMAHLLSARQIWYGRLIGQLVPMAVWEEIAPVDMLSILENNTRKLLAYIQEADLEQEVAYITPTAILSATPYRIF